MRFKATAKQSALQLVKDLDKAEPSHNPSAICESMSLGLNDIYGYAEVARWPVILCAYETIKNQPLCPFSPLLG